MSDEINFTNRNGINFCYEDELMLSCRRDEKTIVRVSFRSYDEYRIYFSNRKFDEIAYGDMLGIVERNKINSDAEKEKVIVETFR